MRLIIASCLLFALSTAQTEIWLSNIPKDKQFHDLLNLVKFDLKLSSLNIKLPQDRDYPDGSRNRGFAFIKFPSHEDAVRAKNALDGYAFGNILSAEWAQNYQRPLLHSRQSD